MAPSSKDRVWDEVNRRYVRWSASRKCWVDENGQRASEPRVREPVAPAPAQPAPTQQMVRPSQTALNAVTAAMGQLNVNAANLPAAAPAAPVRQIASYSGTAQDRSTGHQTNWNVSQGFQYRDPKNADANRSINTKHIRGIAGRPTRTNPSDQYRIGRVIEVWLVPPGAAPRSAVSGITPRGSEREGVRRKRFVIVEILPDQRRFRALPIKTYAGRGVAAFRVIKSHHSIIYTDGLPAANPDEHPRRLDNGQIEDPMQPQAIKVIQRDRTMALDPMSRLDYGSNYQFDFGVPNIRLFGRVHPDSLPFLFTQWNSVYYTIQSTTATLTTASSATAVPSAQTNPPAGPSRTGTGSTLAGAREHADARALLQQYSTADSGRCTEDQMQQIVNYLYAWGRQQGWRVPDMAAASRRLPELARDARVRAAYIQQIRMWWEEDDEADDDTESDENNN